MEKINISNIKPFVDNVNFKVDIQNKPVHAEFVALMMSDFISKITEKPTRVEGHIDIMGYYRNILVPAYFPVWDIHIHDRKKFYGSKNWIRIARLLKRDEKHIYLPTKNFNLSWKGLDRSIEDYVPNTIQSIKRERNIKSVLENRKYKTEFGVREIKPTPPFNTSLEILLDEYLIRYKSNPTEKFFSLVYDSEREKCFLKVNKEKGTFTLFGDDGQPLELRLDGADYLQNLENSESLRKGYTKEKVEEILSEIRNGELDAIKKGKPPTILHSETYKGPKKIGKFVVSSLIGEYEDLLSIESKEEIIYMDSQTLFNLFINLHLYDKKTNQDHRILSFQFEGGRFIFSPGFDYGNELRRSFKEPLPYRSFADYFENGLSGFSKALYEMTSPHIKTETISIQRVLGWEQPERIPSIQEIGGPFGTIARRRYEFF